jgi:acylphosphatase
VRTEESCKNRNVQPDLVRQRVVVRGRVQGVAFRYYAGERARAHNVSGWVTNRPDGSVEAVLEGDPEAVARLVRFFETGPSHARVEQIHITNESPEGLSGFSVR